MLLDISRTATGPTSTPLFDGGTVTAVPALPVTVAPLDGEALDYYLTRVAFHNELTHRELVRYIADRAGQRLINARKTPTGVAPDGGTIAAMATLTGLTANQLQRMTLASYAPDARAGPGTLLPWKPTIGTHICAECVIEGPNRLLYWRLPHATVCPRHEIILSRICPACGKPFRSNTTPAIPPTVDHCDNFLSGSGPTAIVCRHRLADLPAVTATPTEIRSAATVMAATRDSGPVSVCGHRTRAQEFLADLYAISLLLTHLAAAGVGDEPRWVQTVGAEQRHRTGTKIRLSASPPTDMATKTQILTVAAEILSHRDVEAAADALGRHLHTIPDCPAGPLSWIAGHTRLTPTVSRLTIKAIAPRRRVSFQIAHLMPQASFPVAAIPQCIPDHFYKRHFANSFDVLDTTARIYLSLCCARRLPGIDSWAQAGTALGMNPAMARQVALDVSPRTRLDSADLLAKLKRLGNALDRTIDYRQRERDVLAQSVTDDWYPMWQKRHYPLTQGRSGYLNACEWQWQHHACATPFTEHWTHGWNRDRRGRYRRWEKKVAGSIADSV